MATQDLRVWTESRLQADSPQETPATSEFPGFLAFSTDGFAAFLSFEGGPAQRNPSPIPSEGRLVGSAGRLREEPIEKLVQRRCDLDPVRRPRFASRMSRWRIL